MIVRRVRPDEAARWRLARIEAARKAPDAFAETAEAIAARSEADFAAFLGATPAFFAEADDGTLLGIAQWTRDRDPANPRRAWFEAVFVWPAARGQGVSDALAEAIAADAVAQGMDELLLEVAAGNAAAEGAYLRQGFAHLTGPERPRKSCSATDLTMRRALRLPAPSA